MKYLKYFENDNKPLATISELLDVKYWYILQESNDVFYWKVEKINNSECNIIFLDDSESKIENSVVGLENLEHALRINSMTQEIIEFRPLTKEEIEYFESKIIAKNYNL